MDVYFKCESSAVIAQLTASESGDWKVAPKIPGAHLEGTSTSDGSIINIGGTSSYTRGIIQGAVYAGDQFDVYFKSSVYVRDGGESVFFFVLAHILHIFHIFSAALVDDAMWVQHGVTAVQLKLPDVQVKSDARREYVQYIVEKGKFGMVLTCFVCSSGRT
jgi:hypothetical protein